MSIRDNILKIKKEMLNEIDASARPRAEEVQRKALQAIRKGQGSDEWKDYMLLFVDDPNRVGDAASISAKQLARLRGEDTTKGVPEFDDRRAYLTADGTCTVETVTNFGRNATVGLDVGL
ncbi:MAG TPA: hypothetical protein VJ875_13430 [Pyrinomonadaceae bacterium]|nr:hypothetical protein [Pyrinomonadaceae bacterium]